MAPSNVFHYLRPHHNKRSATAPISPEPANASIQHHISSPPLHQAEFFSSPRIPDSSGFTSSSPVSPYPPVLPPIPRVASRIEHVHPGPALTSPELQALPHSQNAIAKHQILDGDGSWSTTDVQQDQWSPIHDSRHPARLAALHAPTGLRAKGRSMSDNVVYGGISGQPSLQLTPPDVVTKTSTFSHSQVSLLSSFMDKSSHSSKSTNSASAQPQKVKSRLNLRNPMSLLMRRRSGQPVENLSDDSLVSHRAPTLPAMPDDYDPRIRGNIVHDFSAPRPRRNFSYNNAYADDQKSLNVADGASGPSGRLSPAKIERAYTPVFREHFDDDTSYEASQAAIRAEQLVNHDFLKRNSIPPPPARSPPPPPMPKDPSPAPPQPHQAPPPLPELVTDLNTEPFPLSVLSPVQEVASPTDDAISEETPRKKMSTKSPLSSRSRATSITDSGFSPAGLPAHLTSRSSRFSFQISGNDSAQEKLLEERHKQKAAEKASKEARMSTNTFEDEYDDNMYDYDMDDGGYEEEIPMLGEDDGFGGNSMSPGMASFDFSSYVPPLNTLMSPLSMTGEDVVQTPRDGNGNAIGFAVSDDINTKAHVPAAGSCEMPTGALMSDLKGLGLGDLQYPLEDHSRFTPADTPEETDAGGPVEPEMSLSSRPEDVDDLYFDDGMIDDQGDIDNHEFDESVFDDPSHPFYERPVKNLPADFVTGDSNQAPGIDNSGTRYSIEDDDDLSPDTQQQEPALAHKNSVTQQNPVPDISSLNAYHSALANAAIRAQAEGRFARKESIDHGRLSSDEADVNSSLSNSRPSLIPDDGRFSQETTGFPPDDFDMSSSFVDDYSDYDSALEDDPMIAAANAEALANDYEGVYGQEFGFYASAHGEAQNAYGGYFGPSGLGRSVSGRNAVREPNLTPITERSEYSTRNSFVSLNHFRDGQQPLQSPALAELVRMSPYGWPDEEPDMSLSSLMKLRKDTFGGSAVSLGSSAGSSPQNASPGGMTYLPRNASPMTNYPLASSELVDSLASVPTDDGEDGDDEALDAVNAMSDTSSHYDGEDHEETREENDSPTLTASDYYTSLSSPHSYAMPHRYLNENLKTPSRQSVLPPTLTLSTTALTSQLLDTNTHSSPMSAPPNRNSFGLISPMSSNSPLTPGGGGAWKTSSGPSGHSRNGSAADSVAYVREHDEQGGDRWVLERRRTAESGELELVGREIVEGGRI